MATSLQPPVPAATPVLVPTEAPESSAAQRRLRATVRWAARASAAMREADPGDRVVRVCAECGRARLALGRWRLAAQLRLMLRRAGLTPAHRETVCRDCLTLTLPEYFSA